MKYYSFVRIYKSYLIIIKKAPLKMRLLLNICIFELISKHYKACFIFNHPFYLIGERVKIGAGRLHFAVFV